MEGGDGGGRMGWNARFKGGKMGGEKGKEDGMGREIRSREGGRRMGKMDRKDQDWFRRRNRL
jgi:hypothetical protein